MTKQYPVGMIECLECSGAGCPDCEGKGYVRCEHWETDHGICLDCGYDETPDLIDHAVDLYKDRKLG